MEMLQQTFVLTYIFMRLILLYLYHTIRKTNGQIRVLRAINECPNDKVKENGGRNYFFLSCYFFFLPQVLLCALRSTDVIWFASAISPAVAAAAVALPSRGFLAALLEHLQKLYRTLTVKQTIYPSLVLENGHPKPFQINLCRSCLFSPY